MNQHAKHFRERPNNSKGFSIVELLIAMAVMLVVSAITLPSLTKSLRVYRLNDAAFRMSGILKLTRFDAIRRNTPVSCRIALAADGVTWNVWADSDGSTTRDSTEQQIVETGTAVLIPESAVPTAGSLPATVNVTSLTTLSGANSSVAFDQRGAVSFAGAPTVYVFYIGSPAQPNQPVDGYRAVVLMPSGTTQIWTGAPNNAWQLVN